MVGIIDALFQKRRTDFKVKIVGPTKFRVVGGVAEKPHRHTIESLPTA
jgi:hypothetical protein